MNTTRLPGWLIELGMLARVGFGGTAVAMLVAAGWTWYTRGGLSVEHMVTPLWYIGGFILLMGGMAGSAGPRHRTAQQLWYRDPAPSDSVAQRDARQRMGFMGYAFVIGLITIATATLLGFLVVGW